MTTRMPCRTVEETQAHARYVARQAIAGDIYALHGTLGAGKTTWTRGFVAALDCSARVRSPTFALLNEYLGGRLPVHHLDLYRLESAADLEAAGLLDYLPGSHGVTVVEWAERWSPAPAMGPAPVALLQLDPPPARRLKPVVHHLVFQLDIASNGSEVREIFWNYEL